MAFYLLAIGPRTMITKMHYRLDNVIPFHSHPNEQCGYVFSGRNQETLLDLPRFNAGHEPILLAELQRIAKVLDCEKQRKLWREFER